MIATTAPAQLIIRSRTPRSMRADLAPSRECEDASAFLVASTVCATLSSLVIVASSLPLHSGGLTPSVLGPDGPSLGGRKERTRLGQLRGSA